VGASAVGLELGKSSTIFPETALHHLTSAHALREPDLQCSSPLDLDSTKQSTTVHSGKA
jgi:hypothetical protein